MQKKDNQLWICFLLMNFNKWLLFICAYLISPQITIFYKNIQIFMHFFEKKYSYGTK